MTESLLDLLVVVSPSDVRSKSREMCGLYCALASTFDGAQASAVVATARWTKARFVWATLLYCSVDFLRWPELAGPRQAYAKSKLVKLIVHELSSSLSMSFVIHEVHRHGVVHKLRRCAYGVAGVEFTTHEVHRCP